MITVTRPELPPFGKYSRYLKKIWKTRWLTNNGEYVQLLEERLKTYLRTDNLAVLSNGTVAIQLALKALGVKGEVITTPFTFAATTNALVWEAVTPVFADIDPETYNIDPADVERKITDKTSAILAVHVYGNPCNVEELQRIASSRGIKVIYDAAHAFGVERAGRSIMSSGDMSTLSFHPTKVYHTIEGGAIAAKDPQALDKVKMMRNHGIISEEEVVLAGTNAKMNEFQAAMGLCNLDEVDKKIAKRERIYARYLTKLKGTPVRFQKLEATRYNYSYMPVLFETNAVRDAVYLELVEKNGVRPRKYFYPLAVEFDYYKTRGLDLVEKWGLRNAAYVADRILCLPIYPDLSMGIVDMIAKAVKKASERYR